MNYRQRQQPLICSICVGNIPQNRVTELVCGHLFHFSCLEPYIRISQICPICQTPLDQGNPPRYRLLNLNSNMGQLSRRLLSREFLQANDEALSPDEIINARRRRRRDDRMRILLDEMVQNFEEMNPLDYYDDGDDDDDDDGAEGGPPPEPQQPQPRLFQKRTKKPPPLKKRQRRHQDDFL